MIINFVRSLFLIALEIWGILYFFDTFLQKRRTDRLQKYRGFLWFTSIAICAFSRTWIGLWRIVLVILVFMCLCLTFYQASILQSLFFSLLNYCLLFIFDSLLSLVMNKQILRPTQKGEGSFWYYLMTLMTKMLWIVLLLFIRKIRRQGEEAFSLDNKEWLKLSIIPIITLI